MIKYIFIAAVVCISCRNNSPSSGTTTAQENKPASTGTTKPDVQVSSEPETKTAATKPDSSRTRSPINSRRDPAPKDTTPMRLVIEFFSVASGIDYEAMIAYEDSLGAYSGRLGKNIDYVKKPWGREGETEFCMRLNELTTSEQSDFVKFTRKMLKNAKWVNINENAVCRH
jgi:hypothetical protein